MKQIFTSLILCMILFASCHQPASVGKQILAKQSSLSLKTELPDDFVPKNYTVVAIGDSLTEGFGDSRGLGGYLSYLEESLENKKGISEVTFYNFGVSGNQTSEILTRVEQKEMKEAIKEADFVLLTAGGNDIMKVVREHFFHLDVRRFDEELVNYEQSLTAILQAIRSENPKAWVGLIGLYNPFYLYFSHIKEMNLVLDNWNKTSEQVVAGFENTFFIGIDDIFQASEENLLHTDFFHPNDLGYKRIAERVLASLQDVL